ncbi:Psi-producing oxygenase A [Fusarium oxysporum f. sp. albedinis]|nr:Psi-producing oxygenase A [Fusarium oxysporum f. sp. albedinis]
MARTCFWSRSNGWHFCKRRAYALMDHLKETHFRGSWRSRSDSPALPTNIQWGAISLNRKSGTRSLTNPIENKILT